MKCHFATVKLYITDHANCSQNRGNGLSNLQVQIVQSVVTHSFLTIVGPSFNELGDEGELSGKRGILVGPDRLQMVARIPFMNGSIYNSRVIMLFQRICSGDIVNS